MRERERGGGVRQRERKRMRQRERERGWDRERDEDETERGLDTQRDRERELVLFLSRYLLLECTCWNTTRGVTRSGDVPICYSISLSLEGQIAYNAHVYLRSLKKKLNTTDQLTCAEASPTLNSNFLNSHTKVTKLAGPSISVLTY